MNKDEAQLDSLILTIEMRLNRFEKNVSHMQKKLTEFKSMKQQLIDTPNDIWTTKAV